VVKMAQKPKPKKEFQRRESDTLKEEDVEERKESDEKEELKVQEEEVKQPEQDPAIVEVAEKAVEEVHQLTK